jgi:hypothetical protein
VASRSRGNRPLATTVGGWVIRFERPIPQLIAWDRQVRSLINVMIIAACANGPCHLCLAQVDSPLGSLPCHRLGSKQGLPGGQRPEHLDLDLGGAARIPTPEQRDASGTTLIRRGRCGVMNRSTPDCETLEGFSHAGCTCKVQLGEHQGTLLLNGGTPFLLGFPHTTPMAEDGHKMGQ